LTFAGTRRLLLAAALSLPVVLLTGCGGNDNEGSTVATPVAPPALPTADRVPTSNAVEPPAGGADDADRAAERRRARSRKRAASGDSILSVDDLASFRRLEGTLRGAHGLAVSELGVDTDVERVGTLQSGAAWSTAKVPVAMAVVAAGGGQSEQSTLSRAIGASDNAAALQLWSGLGGGQAAAAAADQQLREAGDDHTSIEYRSLRGGGYTPFGQTSWALTDQVRFTAGLACSDAGNAILGLMNEVVAGQRWGLGAAGVPAQFKGGWGPGSQPGVSGGYLDRQMGLMMIDDKPLAVTIASRPADGSHETGTRNLTAIARWIVEHADLRKVGASADC
jgi:hypothetical protein